MKMKTPYKNIYNVLKLNRFIVLAVVVCALLSSTFSVWMVFNTNQKALNSAFAINTDGSIIPLKLVTQKENFRVEALAHLDLFHNYFYNIDASNYEYGSPADAIAAVDLALELGREDLELYVYQMIDQFNRAYYRREPPEHIIAREKELFEKIDAGELTEIVFPDFDREMWGDFQVA